MKSGEKKEHWNFLHGEGSMIAGSITRTGKADVEILDMICVLHQLLKSRRCSRAADIFVLRNATDHIHVDHGNSLLYWKWRMIREVS
jgi:hypothetical protein